MNKLIKTLAAGAFVLASSQVAHAEFDNVNLRYATFLASNYYQTQADQQFMQELAEVSGGATTVEPFWQGALGSAREMLNLVRTNAVDVSAVVPAYFPSELSYTAVTNTLPMVFFEGKKVVEASRQLFIDNPSIKAELETNKLKPLIYRYLPNYRIMCTSPIRTLEDLKGKRIVSYGTFVPEVLKAIGAVPVDTANTEVYENLSRGVLDCTYFHHGGMAFRKWHEVAPYLSDLNFGSINAYVIMMNLDKFNSLSAETQKAIEEAADKATQTAISDMQTADDAGKAEMLANGAELVVFEEKEALQALVPDMIELWVQKMTEDGKGDEAQQVAAQVKELTK